MEVGADKDRVENTGAKPLYIAACKGHLDVFRPLVEVGADKDQAKNSGATPLSVEAQNFHLDGFRQ